MKDSYYLNHQAKPRNLLIRAMLIFFMFAFHLFKVLLMATSPSFPILDVHSTSAKPEKFSSQWLLWLSAFFHPCLDTDAFVFHPIRRVSIQTTVCTVSVKKSSFSLADERKEDFAQWAQQLVAVYVLPGWRSAWFHPFSEFKLHFPRSKTWCPAPVLYLLCMFLHTAIHTREHNQRSPSVLFCGAQSRFVE